ncbi:MAG: hypothetical protein N4A31_07445 [Rickettsiales bacterium]|jgi:hypothetical protein|nr:hypothetical protein [Rickettsiales bacterium]
MSANKIQKETNSLNKNSFEEIEKLENIIDESLIKIQILQSELRDLEKDLNHFLDYYYGSGAVFFKKSNTSQQADNDNNKTEILNLDQVKKDIYNKIAKLCSKDNLQFINDQAHDDLLKIEGYLSDGTNQSQSPQDLLSDLTFEYYKLIQQMRELKSKKQNLLESPAYELKQEVMWANIKTSETISKIKDDITHQVNRPN